MEHTRHPVRRLAGPALLLGSSLLIVSCAGFRQATPLSLTALRASPDLAAHAGYTNATGVPSLAERLAQRPDLRVAVLQVAYGVKGRPAMTFTTDISQTAYVTTWRETRTPEVMVPASFAMSAAIHAVRQVEDAFAAQGVRVIPMDQVAQTQAYQRHYGSYDPGFATESGFVWVGAPPMRIRKPSGGIEYAWMGQLWPEASALQDIEAELGEDVLFLLLRYDMETFGGGASQFQMKSTAVVADPDFAGYGVGNFGHVVTSIDVHTDRQPVEGFVRHEGNLWLVNWTPVFEEASRVHGAFGRGFAAAFGGLAHPEG